MAGLNHQFGGIPKRNVFIAFLVFILIGGGAAVAIRITYAELAPFWVTASRFALAAAVFWILVFFKKISFPKGKALIGALMFGILTIGFSYILKAWGLVATPASLYQILMALVPLITLFLSTFHGTEAISKRGIFGAVLALAGIIVIFSSASTGEISIPHIGVIILAAIFMAEGGVLIKRFPPNPPIMTNAIGMTVGAVILGITSLANGEEWIIPAQLTTWLAFLYLVFFVSLIAFMLYLFVLNNWTASGTSYGFVMFPLVTIAAAALLTGENITVSFLAGTGLVLCGVLAGAIIPSKIKRAALEECKDKSGQVLPDCN